LFAIRGSQKLDHLIFGDENAAKTVQSIFLREPAALYNLGANQDVQPGQFGFEVIPII
jgi:hypothetical protein